MAPRQSIKRRPVKVGPMVGALGGEAYEEIPDEPAAPYKPDAVEREVERKYGIKNVKQQIARKKEINRGYRSGILKGL